jgi:hypothetical protein
MCSQFRKTVISIQFLMYRAYLGTYYSMEQWKKNSRTQILWTKGGGEGGLFKQTKNGLRTKFKSFNHILS